MVALNNRIVVTVAAVTAALALGSSLAAWDQTRPSAPPSAQTDRAQSGIPLEEDSGQAQMPEKEELRQGGYWLRDWQGKLGVFLGDSQEPEMVFDVYVKNLPEADCELLANGLYVAEYTDLVSRIEDYIS